MAESDSILQLGIEAARDGNREEARNLFRLLTRQDSSNAQAWLWLAGVAENRDERQTALEHVLELEPNNEMAIKGLNQLGVRPNVRPREEPSAPTMPSGIYTDPEPATTAPESVAVVPPVAPNPAADRARYDVDDDDPYAALDTLSDAMAASPAAVRRSDADIDSLEDAADARAARETARSGRYARVDDDDEETVPERRRVSSLLLGVVIVALVLLFGLLLWSFFRGRTTQVATTDTAATQTAAALSGTAGTTVGGIAGNATPGTDAGAGGDATAVAGGTTAPGTDATAAAGGATAPGAAATAAGGVAAPGTDATAAAGSTTAPGAVATAAPVAPAPGASNADLSGVAPALVAPNTPLESNGWLYDFNQPSYAAPLFGGLGAVQPQGRFAVVLAFVANRSGTTQPLPADFFVIKDAQGRVYTPSPAASNAYVQRGVNADLALGDAIPADGLTRSVALVFDVQPDATNLVFFARSKTDQGWQVLSNVQ